MVPVSTTAFTTLAPQRMAGLWSYRRVHSLKLQFISMTTVIFLYPVFLSFCHCIFFSVITLSTTYNPCVYSVSLSAPFIHIFLLFIFSLITIPYCFSHAPWLWAELSIHPFSFWPYRDALLPPPLRFQGEKPPEITW